MKNIVKRLLINYFQLFLKIPSSYEPDHSRWDSHSFTACNRLIAKKFVRIGGTGGWRRRMARPVAVDYDGRGGRWLKGRLLAASGEGMGGRWELEHRGGGRGQAAFGAGERRRGGGRRGGGRLSGKKGVEWPMRVTAADGGRPARKVAPRRRRPSKRAAAWRIHPRDG